jgi:hypothetical protein
MNKDNIEVIAEMLIKQDETNRQISGLANHFSGLTNQVSQTNDIHKQYMGVSVKQCEQQQNLMRNFLKS